MGLFRTAISLVVASVLLAETAHAQDISDLLEDLEITDVDAGTCTENGDEQHSLSADFTFPINVHDTVFVRDGWIWDVYASINASGSVNGTIAGFISGTLDEWNLGLQGSGSANIRINIPITGRNRRGRTRSFGYIGATVNVELSDIATLRSQCRNGHHGDPVVDTQAPVIRVTISSLYANYTGPFHIFPRLRARIEATMRSQLTQQIQQQIRVASAQYQVKRNNLISQLKAKLPSGCLCLLKDLPFIGDNNEGTPDTEPGSGGHSNEDPTPDTKLGMLDCYRDYNRIHSNPSLQGVCKNSTSGICYRYANGEVLYDQGAVRCEE